MKKRPSFIGAGGGEGFILDTGEHRTAGASEGTPKGPYLEGGRVQVLGLQATALCVEADLQVLGGE